MRTVYVVLGCKLVIRNDVPVHVLVAITHGSNTWYDCLYSIYMQAIAHTHMSDSNKTGTTHYHARLPCTHSLVVDNHTEQSLYVTAWGVQALQT